MARGFALERLVRSGKRMDAVFLLRKPDAKHPNHLSRRKALGRPITARDYAAVDNEMYYGRTRPERKDT